MVDIEHPKWRVVVGCDVSLSRMLVPNIRLAESRPWEGSSRFRVHRRHRVE